MTDFVLPTFEPVTSVVFSLTAQEANSLQYYAEDWYNDGEWRNELANEIPGLTFILNEASKSGYGLESKWVEVSLSPRQWRVLLLVCEKMIPAQSAFEGMKERLKELELSLWVSQVTEEE